MQESFAFLILGVGGLREDQLIYVETRENVLFIIWDIYDHLSAVNVSQVIVAQSHLCLKVLSLLISFNGYNYTRKITPSTSMKRLLKSIIQGMDTKTLTLTHISKHPPELI